MANLSNTSFSLEVHNDHDAWGAVLYLPFKWSGASDSLDGITSLANEAITIWGNTGNA